MSKILLNGPLMFGLQVAFSEPQLAGGAVASEFEVEPVQGRKVSKLVKTMVVKGERMEKHIGDASLSADLPSAKDDFEKVCYQIWDIEFIK